ncbi:uncharacterized protein F5891DRAFT_982552 [Suillus fuscotomentosus]|uniref:Uncharacterized protein n=1 Tax=Suillus fuscotomentosus TaxID=1912939 RepID=A0AAD4HIC6_9AGAM|nr:uncharacterized protein F5891DRAFT_982552 [Suillus fuscotomentosus]KAG1897582.1 hypothetical protein F5891DRAFT_982552 [Suillus fuscotomentosus]
MAPSSNDHQLLYLSTYGQDVLVGNPENPEDSHLITRDQLKLFINYSHALRNKSLDDCPPSPLGYEFFAHAFNSEGLSSTASYINENGVVVSMGAALVLSDIMEEEDDVEITVSSSRMEQLDKMVWHTALSASYQRKKMEARQANQRKEKNYGRKQDQKLTKKGLGKVRKLMTLAPANVVAGPSTPHTTAEEAMNE